MAADLADEIGPPPGSVSTAQCDRSGASASSAGAGHKAGPDPRDFLQSCSQIFGTRNSWLSSLPVIAASRRPPAAISVQETGRAAVFTEMAGKMLGGSNDLIAKIGQIAMPIKPQRPIFLLDLARSPIIGGSDGVEPGKDGIEKISPARTTLEADHGLAMLFVQHLQIPVIRWHGCGHERSRPQPAPALCADDHINEGLTTEWRFRRIGAATDRPCWDAGRDVDGKRFG